MIFKSSLLKGCEKSRSDKKGLKGGYLDFFTSKLKKKKKMYITDIFMKKNMQIINKNHKITKKNFWMVFP